MAVACPVFFSLLLVSIAPVVYFLVSKLTRGDGLERCAAEVKGEPAFDAVEGAVGTHRVHPFMALVHNQQVPVQFLDPFQLVVVAAEINGAFQSLQALKTYLSFEILVAVGKPLEKHISCHDTLSTPQRFVVAYKAVARLISHVFLEVVVPRIGYRWPVGDYQHMLCLHLFYQVVGRECLSETWFGIPQKLTLPVFGPEIFQRHIHGSLLFVTQLIAIVQSLLLIVTADELLEATS